MFDRILLPLDGSALAECTIPHALALAKLGNAEIIPLLVLDGSVSGEGVDPMEWHLRKADAQSYIDAVCAKLQDVSINSHGLLLTGPPYQRIVEQVGKLNIDLVLVSSHGQSGRVDRPFGAIAHKVLQSVGTSVMLVPAQPQSADANPYAPKSYNAILIPLDGSRRAECVLPIASQLIREQTTKLMIVHVTQRPDVLSWAMMADDTRKLTDQFVEHIGAVAQSYLDQIRERQENDTIGILAQADNVAIEVNHIAEQVEADLLLVSAHGAAANPLRAFGDTVSGILNYCRQPVLIYQDRPTVYTTESEAAPFREPAARHSDDLSQTASSTTQQAYY
jgi:nucleotide-binding universal stress UspA family protein